MNEEKMIEFQKQIRENQSDMLDFVKDLDSWSAEMKEKEEKLKTGEADKPLLPPIRNLVTKKRRKKKSTATEKDIKLGAQKKIRGYEYRAWDKFDVDKACAEVDDVENKSNSSDYETDEEAESLRLKQLANEFKEQGNELFKSGKYDDAIESYTRGIDLDPENAVLVANRAMALLKQKRYGAAELDCTTAIALNPLYVKAYARRGAARVAMKKYAQAEEDFKQVIKLEPSNKQAQAELKSIHQLLNPIAELTAGLEICEKGIIKPIYKAPAERSKKPLRRIAIEETGIDESKETKQFKHKLEYTQSNPILKKDLESFDKFLVPSSAPSHSTNSGDSSNVTQRAHGASSAVDSGGDSAISSNGCAGTVSQSGGAKSGGGEPRGNDSLGVKVTQQPEATSRCLSAPTSSFQFQADWKLLRNTSEEFCHYLAQIEPTSFQRVFGSALDSDMLSKIFLTLNQYYVTKKLNTYSVLEQLTTVKRFATIAMFLSSDDKQVLKELFGRMLQDGRCTTEQVDALQRLYSV